jgi:hypothetical protein
MGYVTIEQVNLALRLDLGFDDSPPDERIADVEMKIEQATAIVVDYLKYDRTDWDADTVPRNVHAAVMLVVQSLYDDSAKGEMLAGLGGGDLRNPVVGMLHRMRDPSLA